MYNKTHTFICEPNTVIPVGVTYALNLCAISI